MLGWNEQRAVCSQKAISSGLEAVQHVGCTNAMEGSSSLVFLSCDIDGDSLPVLQFSNAGDFSGFKYQGVGVKVESYMYQCIEESREREEKTQGGGTKTIRTYSYHRDWKRDTVDSGKFGSHSRQAWDAFKNGCDEMHNPRWNSKAPKTSTKYASEMKVGAFTTTMTDKVPIDTPVDFKAPSNWQVISTGSFYSGRGDPSYPRIGDMKVILTSNDPNNLKATVLGHNEAGIIGKWRAPSSWLCSGFTLSDLRMGSMSTHDLFKQLASEATVLTWALRVIGFVVMWLAFCICFGPLEVAGDCIPCIGPWIGDSIAAVSCCVACLPATACTLGIAGSVWALMRPLIGIPCLTAFIIIFGGLAGYIGKERASKRGRFAAGTPNPNYGAAYVQPTMPPPIVHPIPQQAFMPQAMPTAPPLPIWNPNAMCDGSLAKDRVVWLQQNRGMTVTEAQRKVMAEFPAIF